MTRVSPVAGCTTAWYNGTTPTRARSVQEAAITLVERLNLSDLPTCCPRLTAAAGQYLADAAAVCLAQQEHGWEVVLHATGVIPARYLLQRQEATVVMQMTYDAEEATEFGACGIAILVVRQQTGLTVQRAFRGGGFDYWLGVVADDEPFRSLGRLEVSGIRRGSRRTISARIREKLRQVGPADDALPIYAVVVEFGTPEVRVEQR